MKVKFIKLVDDYEKGIKSFITDKRKEEYIGEVGTMIHKVLVNGYRGRTFLYDVKFSDGQVWCLEDSQIERIIGNIRYQK